MSFQTTLATLTLSTTTMQPTSAEINARPQTINTKRDSLPTDFNDSVSSPQSSLTTGNIKLIASASAIVGLFLIVFVVYVVVRIRRGHNIVDVLKLRRKRTQDGLMLLPDQQETNTLPFIMRSQRFSVRSSRYAASIAPSMHSNVSRKKAAHQQYTKAYFVTPQPTTRMAVRSSSAPAPLPTMPRHVSTNGNLPRTSRVPPFSNAVIKGQSSVESTAMSETKHGVAHEIMYKKSGARPVTITTIQTSPVSRHESDDSESERSPRTGLTTTTPTFLNSIAEDRPASSASLDPLRHNLTALPPLPALPDRSVSRMSGMLEACRQLMRPESRTDADKPS